LCFPVCSFPFLFPSLLFPFLFPFPFPFPSLFFPFCLNQICKTPLYFENKNHKLENTAPLKGKHGHLTYFST
jgi:hypothetical protein